MVVKASRIFREKLEQRESSIGSANRKPATRWPRRIARVGSWIGPGAVLFLVPKCPVCLAAYIAFGTGIAISVVVADFVRVAAIIISVAALVGLSWGLIGHWVKRRPAQQCGRGGHAGQG